MISGKEDAANNYARGHYTVGKREQRGHYTVGKGEKGALHVAPCTAPRNPRAAPRENWPQGHRVTPRTAWNFSSHSNNRVESGIVIQAKISNFVTKL